MSSVFLTTQCETAYLTAQFNMYSCNDNILMTNQDQTAMSLCRTPFRRYARTGSTPECTTVTSSFNQPIYQWSSGASKRQCSSQAIVTSTVVHTIATLQCPAEVTSINIRWQDMPGSINGLFSWVIFDINFQQEAACWPTLSWADVAGHRESKLYSLCCIGMAKNSSKSWCNICQSLDHSTSLYPFMPPMKGSIGQCKWVQRAAGTTTQKVAKCQHQHICLHC